MPFIDPYTEYYSKTDYDRLYLQSGEKTIDLWNDKLLYGRVDEFQNSVYISNQSLEQKVKQLDVGPPSLFALNFVADAFNGLKNHIQRANALGRLPTDGLFSSLTPKSGYVNMEKSFATHLDQFYNVLTIYLKNTGRADKIFDLKDFFQGLVDFMHDFPGRLPLTRTTYIKSKFFDPFSTGLMIDILTVDYNNDEKREACTNDKTFEFYHRAARKYGFFIAKHAPWRLIADISSIPMQNYMSPTAEFLDENGKPIVDKSYGLSFAPGTATNLFGSRSRDENGQLLQPYYIKSYLNDISELRLNIVKMWNKFVEQNPYQIKVLKCNQPGKDSDASGASGTGNKFNRYKKDYKERKMVSLNRDILFHYFNDHPTMNDRKFLVAYKNILLFENNISLSDRKNKRLDKTILKYYDVYGKPKTLNYINDYFKKVGGLSANPSYCQSYTLCQDEEQKSTKQKTPTNVTIIQDTTTTTPSQPTPSGGGGGY